MNVFSKTVAPMKCLSRKLFEFRKASKGVAAVEFALIAPLLLVLFVGTVEISLLVSVDRKLSRASSTVADLITQSQAPSLNTIESLFGVVDKIMYPYTDKIPCVAITYVEANVEVDTNGDGTVGDGDDVVARVIWSIDNSTVGYDADTDTESDRFTRPDQNMCQPDPDGAPPAADDISRIARTELSIFPLPDTINTNLSQILVAEIAYDHTPIVGLVSTRGVADISFDRGKISLGDRIYLRPRLGSTPNPDP